jgi:hypothetical protein
MPLTIKVTVVPEQFPFAPTSFQEMLQRSVKLPGLDPAWQHTLVHVDVAPDGLSAEVTVVSAPDVVPQMVEGLRVDYGSPTAHVRVFDMAGTQLSEGRFPAPMQVGQKIAVGDTEYLVTGQDWPGRDPNSGVCAGDVDWQHVVVGAPIVPPPLVPVPV